MKIENCLPSSYHDYVNHIVPGPQSISYFVPLALLPVALLIPPSILSQQASCSIFLPVITAASIHAWIAMGAVDVFSVNTLLWCLLLIGIKDPRTEFTRLVKRDQQGAIGKQQGITKKSQQQPTDAAIASSTAVATHDEVPYPSTFLPRLSWVGSLVVSVRLSDWKVNHPPHDRRQPYLPRPTTRRAFVAAALLRFLAGYLLLDLSGHLIHQDPYFTTPSFPLLTPPATHPYLPTALVPFLRPYLTALHAHWLVHTQDGLQLSLLVLPLPRTHPWSPLTWPPLFGSLAATLPRHGVRGFWSLYWHQGLRWSLAGPGVWLADALLGPSSSSSSSSSSSATAAAARARDLGRTTLVTLVAFALSGVVHAGLVPRSPVHAPDGGRPWFIRACLAAFFWVQPLGMLAERVVEGFVTRSVVTGEEAFRTSALGRKAAVAARLAWLAVWVWCCSPLLAVAAREIGFFRAYTVPVSPINWVMGAEPIAWECLRS